MQDRDVAVQFSARLRQERLHAGLSQEGLALRAGLNRTALGKLERGESQPMLVSVMRLAGALEIDPCRLLPPLRWRRASEDGRWE